MIKKRKLSQYFWGHHFLFGNKYCGRTVESVPKDKTGILCFNHIALSDSCDYSSVICYSLENSKLFLELTNTFDAVKYFCPGGC